MGVVGSVAGVVIGNNSGPGGNDQKWVGGSIGLVAGAGLGYLVCSALGGKQGPSAEASASPAEGSAPLGVQFRGVGSDPDGSITSYTWDLGDGTTASGANVRHTYDSPGDYTARLTVTDNDGMTDSATVGIRVTAAAAAPTPPPPKVVRRIILRGVNFDFDSAELRPEARVTLEAAVEALKENRDSRVQVAGHTDSTGPEVYNQGLSERRAKSVADYLADNGISASRLQIVGFGEGSPVADNGTRDGRAQNRRVELNVLQD